MKIAIAQTEPVIGNIPANIEKHIKLVNRAISLRSDAIFFPELSLTGYEPKISKRLASNHQDKRLDVLQELSDENTITIGAGLPTKDHFGIRISMVIFQPDQPRKTYSKQLLHEDEKPYFVNGKQQLSIAVKGEIIVPGICYECFQPQHFSMTVESGADIYLASVAKSLSGMKEAEDYFSEKAQQYNLPVALSNSIGLCDDFVSCGKSSIWNKDGKLIGQMDTDIEGIMVFNTDVNEIVKQYS